MVGLYMAAIFWLSSRSALPPLVAPVSDKLLHAVTYAGLATAVTWASVRGAWATVTIRHLVVGATVSTLYGLTDEIHQAFVPVRAADPLDLLADASGAVAASVALWAWSIIARGRERHGV